MLYLKHVQRRFSKHWSHAAHGGVAHVHAAYGHAVHAGTGLKLAILRVASLHRHSVRLGACLPLLVSLTYVGALICLCLLLHLLLWLLLLLLLLRLLLWQLLLLLLTCFDFLLHSSKP